MNRRDAAVLGSRDNTRSVRISPYSPGSAGHRQNHDAFSSHLGVVTDHSCRFRGSSCGIGLLSSCRQGHDGRHLDVRRRIPENVELLWIQKHHRAAGACIEGSGVERAVLALPVTMCQRSKTAYAAAPLTSRSPLRAVSSTARQSRFPLLQVRCEPQSTEKAGTTRSGRRRLITAKHIARA